MTAITIHFPSIQSLLVFRCVMKHQIADGMWKNEKNTGWEKWISANLTRNNFAKFGVSLNGNENIKRDFEFSNERLINRHQVENKIKLILEMIHRGIHDLKTIDALMFKKMDRIYQDVLSELDITNEIQFSQYVKELTNAAKKNFSHADVKAICQEVELTLNTNF